MISDPRDVQHEYASDDWAKEWAYYLSTGFADTQDGRMAQADDIAWALIALRDHMQAKLDAARAERNAALFTLMQHNPDALAGDVQEWVRQGKDELAALLAGARAAGYQSGVQEERAHQNALSRLVIEKHKEELLVAGAGWETIDPSCLRYNLGAASWRLDGIAFDLAEFPENMRLQRRVARSEVTP